MQTETEQHDRHGITVEHDVEAIMQDGTRLLADVYRPSTEGDHPVLLHRSPYGKEGAQTVVYQHPSWYARHGYLVVAQDVRGSGRSGGEFDPFRFEAADGAATIRWAAHLPGANGKVGTYGFSYAGMAQLRAAAERPEELVCCAPGFTSSDFYDGWVYRGGALNLAFVTSWVVQCFAVMEALKRGDRAAAEAVAPRLNDFPGLYRTEPLSGFPLLKDNDLSAYLFDWIEHNTRDSYWEDLGLRDRYDRIEVPCLHIGGWYDAFVNGTVENFAAMSELAGGDPSRTQRLVVGPWAHMPWSQYIGQEDFGPEARNTVDEIQLAWFESWLRDDSGTTAEPPVRLFTLGVDQWRDHQSWPPAGVLPDVWHLSSEGRANSLSGDGELSRSTVTAGAPDTYVAVPQLPVVSLGGRSCCVAEIAPIGPYDQRSVEVRNDVLVYTSSTLDQDLEISGSVELVLFASTSAVDVDFTAKLVDVDDTGAAINLCDGIVRASFRDSLAEQTAVVPDQVYEFRINLGAVSNVFAKGHRIRLEVASSNYPAYDLNPQTGARASDVTMLDAIAATQTVFHDAERPSRLILPSSP